MGNEEPSSTCRSSCGSSVIFEPKSGCTLFEADGSLRRPILVRMVDSECGRSALSCSGSQSALSQNNNIQTAFEGMTEEDESTCETSFRFGYSAPGYILSCSCFLYDCCTNSFLSTQCPHENQLEYVGIRKERVRAHVLLRSCNRIVGASS